MEKILQHVTVVKTGSDERVPKRYRNDVGKIIKEGRSRLTVELLTKESYGHVLYLPKECFEIAGNIDLIDE